MAKFWLTYGNNALTTNGIQLAREPSYDPENPYNLNDNTFRFQFDGEAYNPNTSGETWNGTWAQVSESPNVWDFTCTAYSYEWLFKEKFASGNVEVHLLGAVMMNYRINNMNSLFGGCTRLITTGPMKIGGSTGIYYAKSMFSGCTNLESVGYFSLANVSDHITRSTTSELFKNCSKLTTIPLIPTSTILSFTGWFWGCSSLTSVPLLDLSSAVSCSYMFLGCYSLREIPCFNTSNVTNMKQMLASTSIEYIPLMDTSKVTDFKSFCAAGTSALKEIPLLDTTSADDVSDMFLGQVNVESGALALYNQMSTQTHVPSQHSWCFHEAGSNTVTGAQELAAIPESWGGTAT